MIKLFVYGTLQDPDIQSSILGYIPKRNDVVETIWGYSLENIEIEGKSYAIACKSKEGRIHGVILEIPTIDIYLIDKWEGNNYIRIYEYTISDNLCQVYVKRK